MIKKKEDIINFFLAGCKNKDNHKIGVEHEKFIFEAKSGKRISYKTVSKLLNLLTKFGWNPVCENKKIIGLSRGKQSISLEPGNQIELSGEALPSIHLICQEAYKYLDELTEVLKALNLKIMSIGFDPKTKLKDVPAGPKKRYGVMAKQMPKNGKLSLDMMYRTCGTQVNIDYESEEDFIKKFKLCSFLAPLGIALFANSPIVENKKSKFLSYRSRVWQKTSRAGLPDIFLDNMNFEKYADFAMSFPLMLVERKSSYVKFHKENFEDFMHGNLTHLKNEVPTVDDLKLHLSTIFTENRLKQYIEIRSLDTCGWDCLCNGPAFYTGLLYGSLDETLELISSWKKNDILNAYLEAPKKGLDTILNNKTLLDWGKLILKLSEKGLEKRALLNNKSKNETIYLEHIKKILQEKKTRSEIILDLFKKYKTAEFIYNEKN